MIQMKKIWMAALLVLVISGCYNDKYSKLYPNIPSGTTTCDTTTITYSGDIKPIIVANCYSPGNGCHDAVGSATSAYDYETSVIALQGNALDGALVTDINFMPTKGHNTMPKNGTQLPACDINKITRWVNEGAPNN
jgi:hypothetical protein